MDNFCNIPCLLSQGLSDIFVSVVLSDSWLENIQKQNPTQNYTHATQRMAAQALTEQNLAVPYTNDVFDVDDAIGRWSPLERSSLLPGIILVPTVS